MSVLNNQTGAEGNEFRFIAKNAVWIIGGGCTNVAPSTRTNRFGKAYYKNTLSGVTGSNTVQDCMSTSTPTDTSIVHPHGSLSMCVGNTWSSTVGSGGVSITTCGPYRCQMNYGVLISDTQLNLHAKTIVELKAAEAIVLDAPKIHMSASSEMINNNTINTNGNIVANGGFYARGETFITHMNTQAQIMETGESVEIDTYVNPIQSFAVAAGNSTLANKKLLTTFGGLLSAISGELEKSPLFVEAIISLPFPPPIDRVMNLPIKIAFPYGIRLISDGLYGTMPVEAETIWSTRPNKGVGLTEYDSSSFTGHTHLYTGPAATYHEDTASLYNAAKNSGIEGNQAIAHEAVQQGGMANWIKSWLEKKKKQVGEVAKKKALGFAKRMMGSK